MKRPLTPLAIAVLQLLVERPRHPYEMQQCIRDRALDHVIKVKGGSLYHTVERLHLGGLIEPVDTHREGRRPERTVYAITEAGEDELSTWIFETLSRPAQEFPQFGAALAMMHTIDAEQAVAQLNRRAVALDAEVAGLRATVAHLDRAGLQRLHVVEVEYTIAIRLAEREWVAGLIDDIRSGALEWACGWRQPRLHLVDDETSLETEFTGMREAGR